MALLSHDLPDYVRNDLKTGKVRIRLSDYGRWYWSHVCNSYTTAAEPHPTGSTNWRQTLTSALKHVKECCPKAK